MGVGGWGDFLVVAADDGVEAGCASVPAVVAAGGVQSVRAAHPAFAACSTGGGCAAAMVGLAAAASDWPKAGDAAASVGTGEAAVWCCAATVVDGATFFFFPGVRCTTGFSTGGAGSVAGVSTIRVDAACPDAIATSGVVLASGAMRRVSEGGGVVSSAGTRLAAVRGGADGASLGVGCASLLAVIEADGMLSGCAARPVLAACSSCRVGDGAAAVVVVSGTDGVVVGGPEARLLFFRPVIITREL